MPGFVAVRILVTLGLVGHDVLFFLLSLAVLLGSARLLGEMFAKIGFPAVAGEIAAGILIGKTVLGRVAPGAFTWLFPAGSAETMLSSYTTVAVVMLLVVAGFEIDLAIVRRTGRLVVWTAVPGVVLPFLLGFGVGMILPDADLADPSRRMLHALFLGVALSISALPVIAKTLLDLGLMKTEFGLLVLSAAVFNDFVGWIAFSALARAFSLKDGAGSGHFAVTAGLTVVFVLAAIVVVRPLFDRALAHMATPQESASGRVLSIVMVLALVGAAATEALGMHAVFGGFVMGIAVGDSKHLREHTRQVVQEFVTNVFTPVFFATMALRVDFLAAIDLRITLLILSISCVGKVIGCGLGARLGGLGAREAMAVGFGMNSRGAMEILLSGLALEAGIINQRVFVALVLMALVTSMISGPAMSRLLRAKGNPIATLLRGGFIDLGLQDQTRDGTIAALVSGLAARLGRPGDALRFTQDVLQREELAGTGLGDGIAIPHAEVVGLEEPALAFGRSSIGLDFDAPDGERAHLVFLLLTPPRDFDRELKLLAEIARLLMQPDVRAGLLAATDKEAVLGVLEGRPGPVSARLSVFT